jgi:hypothetical protein
MRLPVSGLDVFFRLPDGRDDLAILEASFASRHARDACNILERALDALARLTTLAELDSADRSEQSESKNPLLSSSHPQDPIATIGSATSSGYGARCATITDFEHALLGLRRFLFGDSVHSLVRCTCSERMEIDFSVATLLRASTPRTPDRILPSAGRPGWFTLPEEHITFRLPTVADQLHALATPHPYALLEQSCIDAGRRLGRRALTTVERAMGAMAPAVSRSITGTCAACGESICLQLHVPTFVLDELCASASGIHREIHAIASTYHWPESTILALPQLRRHAYTDAIHQSFSEGGL